MEQSSGVGVIDKAVSVLDELAGRSASLAELCTSLGMSRATTWRLATALETHGLVGRDSDGRFTLGPRIVELAGAVVVDSLETYAVPVLAQLRDATGESAQLYRRTGTVRRCVAAAERSSGLRDTVPVGSELPMTAGSAAQVLLAWLTSAETAEFLALAAFSASLLTVVRRRGWAASVGQREPGVASVSAPVFGADGSVIAAVSVSGPIDRLTRSPGKLHAEPVVAAANRLSTSMLGGGQKPS